MSRCLTNIPTPFGARRSHLQGLTSQQLTFQHVDWSQTPVRPRVAEI
jgi:hypothetical protein